MAEAARRLGCSTGVIYYWIQTGQLTARRGPGGRLCIPWNAQAGPAAAPGSPSPPTWAGPPAPARSPHPPFPAADGEISVTEAACQLGCSTGVIYYWIETGQLTARRGPGNRLHIPWNDQIQADAAPHHQSGHLNPAARRTRPRQRR